MCLFTYDRVAMTSEITGRLTILGIYKETRKYNARPK